MGSIFGGHRFGSIIGLWVASFYVLLKNGNRIGAKSLSLWKYCIRVEILYHCENHIIYDFHILCAFPDF